MDSKLLDLLLKSKEPKTLDIICEESGQTKEEVVAELDTLLSSNFIRKREFPSENGETISVYWASHLIPFGDSKPIVTSPFPDPFDQTVALERLNDQQLQQEKLLLQTKLRKLNADLSNLMHRSKQNFQKEKEAELDEIIKKWVNACQEMLYELKSKLKQQGTEITMSSLIQNLRINPETVRWNVEEEDFDPPN